jgi:hypothetical protein
MTIETSETFLGLYQSKPVLTAKRNIHAFFTFLRFNGILKNNQLIHIALYFCVISEYLLWSNVHEGMYLKYFKLLRVCFYGRKMVFIQSPIGKWLVYSFQFYRCADNNEENIRDNDAKYWTLWFIQGLNIVTTHLLYITFILIVLVVNNVMLPYNLLLDESGGCNSDMNNHPSGITPRGFI